MAETQSRFDRDVDRAWRGFRVRLADHVAGMRDGDGLVLEPLSDEAGGPAGPCVQFYAWGDEMVRCEVPSNVHLSPDRHLTSHDEAMLLGLGLQQPSRGPEDPEDGGSPAFWIDRPGVWADQLAEVAVRALRGVWGVPHPLFLRAETFGAGAAGARPFESQPADAGMQSARPHTPGAGTRVAVEPDDDEHLRELIESTLHERVGAVPAWDEDGDLVLRVGGVLVFVGVGPGGGSVDLFAPIVHSITGRTRAAEICVDLNRRWPHLKFVLVDDRVAVVDHLRASPFVPAHLMSALDSMSGFVETLDGSFASHLGGVLLREHDHECDHGFDGMDPDFDGSGAPWDEPSASSEGPLSEEEDDLPVALLAVRDFHLGGRTGIPPGTVAAVGDWKPEQLQRFLTISTELHVWWADESRARAESCNSTGVQEADAKALEWELTSKSLAAALQFLAHRDDSAERGVPSRRSPASEQPALFDNPDEPTLFDGLGDYN